MKLFLAGWQATNKERETAVIEAGFMKYRCFSFANIEKLPGFPYYLPHIGGAYKSCIENNVGIMLDSGVFSYRTYLRWLKKRNKKNDKLVSESGLIDRYAEFVKANHHLWSFAVTMDISRDTPVENYHRHIELKKRGLKLVPVLHGVVDDIKRYYDLGDTFQMIGSRSIAAKSDLSPYFRECHNVAAKYGVTLHSLGQTSVCHIVEWPWESVDSSSWSRAAGCGCIIKFDDVKQRMTTLHISDRDVGGGTGNGTRFRYNQKTIDRIREDLKNDGFDLDELRTNFTTRHVYNARTMLILAEYATKRHGQNKGDWEPLF